MNKLTNLTLLNYISITSIKTYLQVGKYSIIIQLWKTPNFIVNIQYIISIL